MDVAVLPTKPLTLTSELKLRRDLFKHFKRTVDLVILPQHSPLLLGQIAQSGRCLFGERKDFTAFRVNAMKQFIDFKPYFELQAKTLKRQIEGVLRKPLRNYLMPDKELILQKLQEIVKQLAHLKQLARLKPEQLFGDESKYYFANGSTGLSEVCFVH